MASFGHRPQLSEPQARLYLARLDLDLDVMLGREKSLSLLADLMLAHLTHIPFDSTRIHITDDSFSRAGDDERIAFLQGDGLPTDLEEVFELVILRRRGGFCYTLSVLFSCLLRFLGFTVTDIHARNNIAGHLRKEGTFWGMACHIILLVHVGDSMYYVDIGYGGGAATSPILLRHGERIRSLSPAESYELRNEVLPETDASAYAHASEGWTLYRHLAGSCLPVTHFHTSSILAPSDIQMIIFFVCNSPLSPQAARVLVFRLIPNTEGDRQALVHYKDEPTAKFYVRSGETGKVIEEETFEPTIGNIVRCLEKRFDVDATPLTKA